MAFPPLGNSIMLLFQFPSTFLQTQNGMPLFIAQLMTILALIWMVFMIIWEMFHGRISLNLVLLLLVLSFVSRSRLEIDLFVVSIRWSLIHVHGFQLLQLLVLAIAHRNHLFRLYQHNKSPASKVKFRQVVNITKGSMKLPNLFILIKQKKRLALPRNLAHVTFGELLIVLSSASDKAKLLKTFLTTRILITAVFPYVLSLLELIWNL